ncbi:MAG: MarC family protein [Hyphomicrobiales bacterium]
MPSPRAASVIAILLIGLSMLAMAELAQAQEAGGAAGFPTKVNAWKVFVMLFLMLGPTKILAPFMAMTAGSDNAFRRALARRAIIFSAAALALAGSLGKTMLDNLNISLPVLTLAAGLILFLVALQTVLQQGTSSAKPASREPPGLQLAYSPLAFPTIVTPYGIAAVIVFATLAQDDRSAGLALAGVVLLILAMNWIAMIFVEPILKWAGPALQVFAVVVGVTQVALGLQLIVRSLVIIGAIAERTN